MIVRDEERHLAGCLASLAPVVDEVVVVDTGSRDATVQIARSAGARVVHRAWDGDFSAARNAGLDLAAGRWILYIDADERLRPVERDEVEALLRDAQEAAFRVLLAPSVGWTPYREYRLWRNDRRIRFAGVMHEQVTGAISAVARADGRPIGDCGLTLDHLGYEGDQTHKHRRNLPLLEAQLATDPTVVFNWRHLARVRRALGDEGGADAALARAAALAWQAPPGDPAAGLALADLVRRDHERGEDVTGFLEAALALHPGNWLLVWLSARVHMDHGRPEAALGDLDRLVAVDPDALADAGVSYQREIFGAYAHDARGEALLRLGRPAEAAAAYAEAERLAPHDPAHAVRRRLAAARAARRGAERAGA